MAPSYKKRSPEEIISTLNHFDSAGRIFKAVSWLEAAREKSNVSALEYAALETRLGIEQLLFEQLVIGVGTKLEKREYKRCTGNAKKLEQIINSLIPRYEMLIEFTIALAPRGLPIAKWDNKRLIKLSGKVSNYLHWSGGLDVTVQSKEWFEKGLVVVSDAASYVWGVLTTSNTGIMPIEKLEPEMKELWEKFSAGEISIESVVKRAEILEPMLQKRLTRNSS